jgi:hypothetical protein
LAEDKVMLQERCVTPRRCGRSTSSSDADLCSHAKAIQDLTAEHTTGSEKAVADWEAKVRGYSSSFLTGKSSNSPEQLAELRDLHAKELSVGEEQRSAYASDMDAKLKECASMVSLHAFRTQRRAARPSSVSRVVLH